uniref:Uncharacterized protein n=1 Tax=Anguilla anguilla TaxID=7936 RepID=A0A0E9WIL4_ANGAN
MAENQIQKLTMIQLSRTLESQRKRIMTRQNASKIYRQKSSTQFGLLVALEF